MGRRHVVAIDARRSGGSGIGRYTQCVIEAFRSSEVLKRRFTLVELVGGEADPGSSRVRWDAPLLSPWRSKDLERALRSAKADLLMAPQYYVPPVSTVPVVRVLHDAHPFWPDYQSPAREVFEHLYGVQGLRALAEDIGLDGWDAEAAPQNVAALIQRMYQVGANAAAELVTVSKFSAAELTHFLPATGGRWSVAYPFVPRSLSSAPRASARSRSPLLLGVSKLEPRKHQLALIAAVEGLRSEYPNARLTLVGGPTASFPDYAQLVRDAAQRTSAFVSLVENATDSMLAGLYRSCDLFVSASVSEGFGFPGLEALDAGARVLVGSNTSMPEIYGTRAEYFDESGLREEAGSAPFHAAVHDLQEAIRSAVHSSDGTIANVDRDSHGACDGANPTVDSFGEQLCDVLDRAL